MGGRDQSIFQWRVQKEAVPEIPAAGLPQEEVAVYYAPARKLVIVRRLDLSAEIVSASQRRAL